MYDREPGDDLLSTDKRLKYKWKWSRIATQIDEEEIKKWTHFQCSQAFINGFELEAAQWGSDEDVTYGSTVYYRGEHIISLREKNDHYSTRIDAQIGAEILLHDWVTEQYNKIVK